MDESAYRFPTLPGGGIQTNRPANLVPANRYPFLRNFTRLLDGQVNPRFGYGAPISNPGGGLIHTICRVNNIAADTSPAYYLIGAGGNLYVGTSPASLTLLDSGYSGSPLSIIPYRPDQSPDVYAYVFDIAKFRKYRVAVILSPLTKGVGIAAPLKTPLIEIDQLVVTLAELPTTAAGWAPSGIAGSVSLVNRIPAGAGMAGIIYDNGTTGWATVGFTASNYGWLGNGSIVVFNPGGPNEETLILTEITTVLASTTISAITYDSGTTGECCIQMASPFQALSRNSFLFLAGNEFVRVESVAIGRDGLPSFRCKTVFHRVVGETITSYPAARVFFPHTHISSEPISGSAIQFTNTLAAQTTSGVGSVAKAITLDLSKQANTGTAFGPKDYIHISVLFDQPQLVVEGRLYFSTTPGNSFYVSFSPSQFAVSTAAGVSTAAARQGALVQQTINEAELNQFNNNSYGSESVGAEAGSGAGPFVQQLGSPIPAFTNPGGNAWTELFIPYSALTQIGSDGTSSLAGITQMTVWANVSGTVNCQFACIWGGGGFGPDCVPATNGVGFQFPAYIYRSRFRNSKTGAVSPPGPATYSGILPIRTRAIINPPISSDPQVDYVDIERLGGSAFDTFHYVGSMLNTPNFFSDNLTDDAVRFDETFAEDAYQPFAVDDLPRSGMVSVAGTTVTWTNGDLFNTQWVGGTQILIDQIAYTLAGSPKSITVLWTLENVGALTNVPYSIPTPTLYGQMLPAVWGPLRQRLFGCGSPNNPGMVFFTFVDNPDANSDTGWVEVTSPSEPLMNGCIYEESSIVFSTERAFRLEPSYGENPNLFTPLPLASGRGLYARFGLCVGPKIWFVGRDGIYEYAADGGSVSITDDTLYNLFPHDSQPGLSVTLHGQTIVAPNYAQQLHLRLSYCNNWVYFDYLGLDSAYHTLAYHTLKREWYPYDYHDGATTHYTSPGVGVNETLIGFANGVVGAMAGVSDNGNVVVPMAATADWLTTAAGGALYIQTLFTTHGLNGWQHIRELYLQYSTANPAIFIITTGDGRTFTTPLPASAGVSKLYFACPIDCKAETFRYTFVGTSDFLLYEDKCEVHVKEWGSGGTYQPVKAFTDLYRMQG